MRLLFLLLIISASLRAQNITRVEYFFDTDPGFGNGISIPVAAAPDLSQDFTVPLNTVSNGFHKFYIRAQSSLAQWSIPQSQPVFINNNTLTFITNLEYFFDTDPGFGNGITIPITSAVDVFEDFTIPLTSINSGFHTIHLRAKNMSGQWSLISSRTVFVQVNTQLNAPFPLKKIEYFLDSDPGFGNGISQVVNSIQIDQTIVADLSLAAPGFHILYMRSQDFNNRWSLPFAKPFFVARSGSNIVALEYYYTDGVTQSPMRAYSNFTPSQDLTIDFNAVLDGLLPSTSYTIYVTAINADGQRSAAKEHTFITPAIVCDPITPPASTDAGQCGAASVNLSASGATGTQSYVWYETPTTTIAIAGETTGLFTTSVLADTTTFYVAIKNETCESSRTAVTAFINAIPAAPLTTNNSSCGSNSTVSLTATGGTTGQYRWYTTLTSGTPIAGETNSTFTTPPLLVSSTFYVAINNGTCESTRTPVTAVIDAIPSKPLLTSSITLIGNELSICDTTQVTLSAPAGFSTYTWSNGATTQQITVNSSGTFSVNVSEANGCISPESDAVTITVVPALCNNQPPVINPKSVSTSIGSTLTIDLLELISDADNNLNNSSLKVTQPPISGSPVSLINGILQIDYRAADFVGKDELTIEVCDVLSACTQQVIEIDVQGNIEIYNALSPNNDGKNDFFYIQYIELLPETKTNTVTIYNRWGSKVFEVDNYNNDDRVFRGLTNNGNELPSGTYFYKIQFNSPQAVPRKISGYLELKR